MPESQSEWQRRWDFWQGQVARYREFTSAVTNSPAEQELETVTVGIAGDFNPVGPLPPIPGGKRPPQVPATRLTCSQQLQMARGFATKRHLVDRRPAAT